MEIKIDRSAHQCLACERPFSHEEPIWSRVCIGEEGLLREDYCSACWDAGRAGQAFSAWSAKYYDPKVAEQEPPEVFSPLRQLFYEAVESEERAEQAKAYLAAQLLRRQKVFRQIKESEEEGTGRLVLFSDRIGNRLIEVRDPSFSFSEMEAGRSALLARLEELEAPTEVEPDAGEAAPVEDHGESKRESGKDEDAQAAQDKIAQ